MRSVCNNTIKLLLYCMEYHISLNGWGYWSSARYSTLLNICHYDSELILNYIFYRCTSIAVVTLAKYGVDSKASMYNFTKLHFDIIGKVINRVLVTPPQGTVSIWKCCLTGMIRKIWSDDCLIFIMEITISGKTAFILKWGQVVIRLGSGDVFLKYFIMTSLTISKNCT